MMMFAIVDTLLGVLLPTNPIAPALSFPVSLISQKRYNPTSIASKTSQSPLAVIEMRGEITRIFLQTSFRTSYRVLSGSILFQ
ncbi:hypothetical protein CEXT_609691 [Caerostris extrusa]|uniref:Secreted protein n=1 Tax=Caerostris extrusa TaxID=172846 RepID=A0AAV4PTF2_CAEEX|nr:hypothetical protein CEXT_609691 [Caerostris extrusa]